MSSCMVRATDIESHRISAVSSCLFELLTPEEDCWIIKATIIFCWCLIAVGASKPAHKVECQQSGVHVYLTISSATDTDLTYHDYVTGVS